MRIFHKVLTITLIGMFILLAQGTTGFAAPSLLKKGMTGNEVLQLQQRLSELGYYQGAPDGLFGTGTHSAVYNFQVANNLSADGIAGAVTLGALNLLGTTASTAETPVAIKEGMSGDSVLKLQQLLSNSGYYQGALDGYFGPGTRSAVLSFQASNNLTADGVAGTTTLAALQNLATTVSRGNNTTTGTPAVLKQGMSGESVLKLQQQLHNLGYYQGAMDGSFGANTRCAVVSFQYDNKLTVDGIAGPNTMLAMQIAQPKATLANRGQGLDRDSLAIAEFAKQYLGVPYIWAGKEPSGFDCSGFVYYVYSNFNIDVPRMADGQYYAGEVVSYLQPGDLVFFTTYEPGPSHVGIYIGNNEFIHASSGAGEVTITSLSASYYSSRYLGARRFSI